MNNGGLLGRAFWLVVFFLGANWRRLLAGGYWPDTAAEVWKCTSELGMYEEEERYQRSVVQLYCCIWLCTAKIAATGSVLGIYTVRLSPTTIVFLLRFLWLAHDLHWRPYGRFYARKKP